MHLGQLKLKEIDLFEKMDWSRDTLLMCGLNQIYRCCKTIL
jgi:hypothetical protein